MIHYIPTGSFTLSRTISGICPIMHNAAFIIIVSIISFWSINVVRFPMQIQIWKVAFNSDILLFWNILNTIGSLILLLKIVAISNSVIEIGIGYLFSCVWIDNSSSLGSWPTLVETTA